MTFQNTGWNALTTELWGTHGERGHIPATVSVLCLIAYPRCYNWGSWPGCQDLTAIEAVSI